MDFLWPNVDNVTQGIMLEDRSDFSGILFTFNRYEYSASGAGPYDGTGKKCNGIPDTTYCISVYYACYVQMGHLCTDWKWDCVLFMHVYHECT